MKTRKMWALAANRGSTGLTMHVGYDDRDGVAADYTVDHLPNDAASFAASSDFASLVKSGGLIQSDGTLLSFGATGSGFVFRCHNMRVAA